MRHFNFPSDTRLRALAILILLTVAQIGFAETQNPQKPASTDVRELKPGDSIERELKGGEAHSYHVVLTAGQYLQLVVEQKGIDVVVRVFGPDGKALTEVDSDPAGVAESAFVIADVSGAYRVEARSPNKGAKAGRYEMRIGYLRESTDKDRARVNAQKVFEEANQLRDQQTAESRRKAIGKYEEALPMWRALGEHDSETRTLIEIGLIYSRNGEPQKAMEYFNQSLDKSRSTGNQRLEAQTLGNIGMSYWRRGQSDKAQEYALLSLNLAKALGDRYKEATALNNLGLANVALGQLPQALGYYQQALPIWQEAGDRAAQGITLNNIGNIHLRLGELQNALQYYYQALELRQAAGDRRGEANTLHNIGGVYDNLGEFQKALDYYNQTILISRALGDRPGEVVTLDAIGLVYRSLAEPQQALIHHNQALELSRAVRDRRLEGHILSHIGLDYQDLGEWQRALDLLNQALLIRRELGDRYGEAYSLSGIGSSYAALGQPQQALEYYHQALRLSRDVGDRKNEAVILYKIARAERGQGKPGEARAHIEAALEIVETTRGQVTSPELRSSYSASNQDYYEFYVDLLVQMHQAQPVAQHDVMAFGAVERARARGLVELLVEARIDVKQGIMPALKLRESELHGRITWIQTQLIQANSQAKPNPGRVSALEEEFKKVETERERVETEIRKKHPRYANLRYPTPLGLKSIQQLLDEKTVLLEYSLGKDAAYLFAITRNDFLTARLPATSLLTNQVLALREAVAVKPDRVGLSNYLKKARSLYEDLVRPANRLLPGKQSLIIIPDGVLHYLPFELLLQSNTGRKSQIELNQLPYLIRNFSISYSPSATVLASLRNSDRANPPTSKLFLGVGDPLYGKTESEQTATVRSAFRSVLGESKPWELQQLPESRREVERIAKLYSPSQVAVFLGERAREDIVKAEGRPRQYRFVHFAVHGLLNENKPQYSGLVLSLPRNDKEPLSANGTASSSKMNQPSVEDGLLQVYEIFNLKMDADLIVLSACETGLGKEIRGEGLVGLTQAFLYAGAPSVVVSIWKVQDRSTADLMVGFYRHLNDPQMNKAAALRQSKLEMIRKGAYSHPYYWAGFVLIGQP